MKGIALLFVVPVLIAACPLIAILFLRRARVIRDSSVLAIITTLLTTALGFGTAILSTVFCASTMADMMPNDDSKCLTGPLIFLPMGLLFTGIAFLVGLVLTIQSFRQRLSGAPLHK
jgi:hypothetical protein